MPSRLIALAVVFVSCFALWFSNERRRVIPPEVLFLILALFALAIQYALEKWGGI